jgi:FtsZ-binding cell division protein ZapB
VIVSQSDLRTELAIISLQMMHQVGGLRQEKQRLQQDKEHLQADRSRLVNENCRLMAEHERVLV